MKKTIPYIILAFTLIFISVFIGMVFSGALEKNLRPLSVSIDTPITISQPVAEMEDSIFKYVLVKETSNYYLHKLESWETNNGIVIFKCSVCGNIIRVPEANIVMYDKITIKTAWADYADICSGNASDWHELLGA